MYCVKCGVKLADNQTRCPLCGTVCCHPDFVRQEGQPLYPRNQAPAVRPKTKLGVTMVTMLFFIPFFITLLCDLRINRGVTWSGYVMGGLAAAYVVMVLPFWFRKPNPVIFVPCDFVAVGLYLLYIDLYTQGGWFLSFAFPVVGAIGLLVTAVVTLCRYLRRGLLYVYGGALIVLGALMPLFEFLMMITFKTSLIGWAVYPLVSLVLLGGFLLFVAAYKPARETMERKFFL